MLTIGTLAKRTGTHVPTIRYYQHIGLMPAPDRTEGGQRRYAEGDLDRLAFIRHSRDLGFGIDGIRELLDMSDRPDRSCADVDEIARRHLAEMERRMDTFYLSRHELIFAFKVGTAAHVNSFELGQHGR